MSDSVRKIIHVDMDAFYASVEQRDEPAYRGKPLIVGGSPQSRGVVAACSYEARAFGVRSAMPCSQAHRLCPEAIFVKPRFAAYREVSQQIHDVFKRYTDLVEPLSLDEAYLDVSHCEAEQGSATLIAQAIKREILDRCHLVASAGVSYNKFLAKVASDVDKPDGLYVIRPDQAQAFIDDLPIGRFFGVGRVTEQKMRDRGIQNGKDLRQHSKAQLTEWFGKSGAYYYHVARGEDQRPVKADRVRKSIGCENTFSEDLRHLDEAEKALQPLIEKLAQLLANKELRAKTLTLKVRYNDFSIATRSQTLSTGFRDVQEIETLTQHLMTKTELGIRPVRLLGVSASHLEPIKAEQQLSLFQGD